MSHYIFNFVEGGVIQYSLDEHGEEVDNAITIDFDSLESGECPICMYDFEEKDVVKGKFLCPECGFHEDDDSIVTINKFLAWEAKE